MRPTLARAAASDIFGVLIFVIVGRNNHQEGNAISGIISVAAPFLIGLGLGWLIAKQKGLQPPTIQFGLIVWSVTLVAGMLLRRVAFNRGTAPPFVIVAMLFLALVLLGWRAAIQFRQRR